MTNRSYCRRPHQFEWWGGGEVATAEIEDPALPLSAVTEILGLKEGWQLKGPRALRRTQRDVERELSRLQVEAYRVEMELDDHLRARGTFEKVLFYHLGKHKAEACGCLMREKGSRGCRFTTSGSEQRPDFFTLQDQYEICLHCKRKHPEAVILARNLKK